MTEEKNTMSLLPESWILTKLGEISKDPQYGWTTSAVSEGRLHLLRTTDITTGKIDWNTVPFCKEEPSDVEKYLLKDGDIVISRAGSVGYSHFIKNPKSAIFASYLIRFKPLIEERYLAHFLKSPFYWQSISEKSIGIAIPNVNASKLKQILIPLAPFPEQGRIADKIEELFTRLDAGIEGLWKVKAQLKRYRQAILKYAFEGKLTEEWRKTHKNQTEPATKLLQQIKQERTEARNHELSPIEESDLPTLPDDWTWTTLNEVSQINMGQSPIGSSYNNSSRGVPLLNGPTEFGEEHPTAVQWTTSPTKICNKDDLLICVRGNTTGRMNWADQQYCIGRGLAAISPLENIVKRELLYYFLLMKVEEIMRRTRGSTFPNLKSDELHRFPFPLAPYIEQEELVERIETAFSTAHRLERNMATALLQSERLRQSILKAAFEGKLVPQDPNDEPAEKLLEHIKDEKAKSKGEKDINKKKNKPKQLELTSYVK